MKTHIKNNNNIKDVNWKSHCEVSSDCLILVLEVDGRSLLKWVVLDSKFITFEDVGVLFTRVALRDVRVSSALSYCKQKQQ